MTSKLEAIIIDPAAEADACVIWLHGLGADGNDFVPVVEQLGLAEDHGIRFVFPHAPVRPITVNGGMRMRGWFDISGIGRQYPEDEAGIREAQRLVDELVNDQIEQGISNERMILMGFSQGGAMALQCGLRSPLPLAGIMALSSYLPLVDSIDDEINLVQIHTPIAFMHGEYDTVVPIQLGRESYQTLSRYELHLSWQEYPMDHSVCLEELQDIGKFLRKHLPAL